MKKHLIFLVLFMFISLIGNSFSLNNPTPVERNGIRLYYNQSNRDYNVSLSGTTENEDIMLMILYNGERTWLDLDIENNSFEHNLWLTYGIGEYLVYIMVHEGNNFYRRGPSFKVEVASSPNRFLYPSKDIESDHPEIIALAEEITEGLLTDREKAIAISDWIIDNTRYDFLKYFRQQRNDFSDPYGALHMLRRRAGVCYDYSALFAALGRASGLQVKMVAGDAIAYSEKQFHAWNEVFLTVEDRWVSLDVTFSDLLKRDFFDSPNFEDTHTKHFVY